MQGTVHDTGHVLRQTGDRVHKVLRDAEPFFPDFLPGRLDGHFVDICNEEVRFAVELGHRVRNDFPFRRCFA